MSKISTLIIDEEFNSRNYLKSFINNYFYDNFKVFTAAGFREGLDCISRLKPRVVFINIEMSILNGFDFLLQLPERNFSVIFLSRTEKHAIKALRSGAIDYLLKPFNMGELSDSITRVLNSITNNNIPFDNCQTLLSSARSKNITISTKEEMVFLETDKIIRCEAFINYTNFILADNKKLISSKTLKEYDDQLCKYDNFIRVHRSHLVNADYIQKVQQGVLILKDQTVVPIARRKKEEVFRKLSLTK